MRYTKTITINETGRDKGKVFVINEPSTMESEKIYCKLNAICGGSFNLAEFMNKLTLPEAVTLWDSLLSYIQIMPTPSRPDVLRLVNSQDIEELSTLIKLKAEVIAIIFFDENQEAESKEADSQEAGNQ